MIFAGAMGIGGLRERSLSVERQSELRISGANTGVPDNYRDAGMHCLPRLNGVSQPMVIRRVLTAGR